MSRLHSLLFNFDYSRLIEQTGYMMIEARGLVRTFKTRRGPVQAVQGVDLAVADGEIVGFLGPNGAGKTTTMRMLATLIQPTSGTATVAGCDLAKDPVGVRRRIGYVAQSGSTLPEAIAGDEVVDHARLYGVPKADAIARGQQLFEELDLPGLWRRQCKTLSGGQRRRLDIVMGLIHDPKLIFLDEPTTGLDPQARANLWEHIRGLRARGATIFLTTHYLDEADALCDRILVIDHGKIVGSGSPEELKQQVSGDGVRLDLADAAQAPAVAEDRRGAGRRCGHRDRRPDGELPHSARRLGAAGAAAVDRCPRHRAGGCRGASADVGRRVPDHDRPVAARRGHRQAC